MVQVDCVERCIASASDAVPPKSAVQAHGRLHRLW